MKKIFKLFLLMIFIFVLASCGGDKKTNYTSLKVLSFNDLHGTLEASNDNYGVAGLSWYINKEREVKDQAVLVLSAGDSFQGTAISNYTSGLNTLKIFNEMKVDAMAIGNHEFDWGLDTVLNYVDGNKDNGEASFSFLSCNLFEKATNAMPNHLKAYEVFDYGNFQVGVIGYIGVGLEEDISASNVQDYTFVDPVPIISELSKKLRNDMGCEIVIAMGHDASDITNNMIGNLKDDEAVDMIINGHSHTLYNRSLRNGNGIKIPVTQAASNAKYLTETIFDFDNETSDLNLYNSSNIDMGSYEIDADKNILDMVNDMVKEIEPVMGEVLAVAGRSVTRTSVSQWTADEIKKASGADFAAINSGGIRSAAFPIANGSSVTLKKIYEVMPFDNTIKTCEMTGTQVKNLFLINDAVFSSNAIRSNNVITINGEVLDENKIYTFACVDFLFDREETIYNVGNNITFTGVLVRDVMVNALKDLNSRGEKWLNA